LRQLLHHTERARIDREIIETFNTVDYEHIKARKEISNEVQGQPPTTASSRSLSVDQALKCTPGRYSVGRFLEDQASGRTVSPNHQFYTTSDYDQAKGNKTLGSLKAAPKVFETVVS
jgi:hypothetical protein